MFEDNCYEPIAEIYLTLNDQPRLNDIYCLYSRVFVEGSKLSYQDDIQDVIIGEELEEAPKTGQSGESSVRFCNSFTESQPSQTPKKSHDEAVSCYCSASHYSTDEHDSLRESLIHHSDSGADLSESSRDLDWERYWTLHGERLIWESWISKYGSYIDPSYLSSSSNTAQKPAEGDDTSFCIQEDKTFDKPRKTSFVGALENTQQTNNVPDNPKIFVETVNNELSGNYPRRLSDISDTVKSTSERSDELLDLNNSDKLRLSVFSECSINSAPLSVTTDSMTSVTHITLSSSDSSYGIDDSSAKSSSILSSSDSAHSVDQQWQLLWTNHFNEQYNYHYSIFSENHKKREDSGLTVEEHKVNLNTHCQEAVEESSIVTEELVSETEQCDPTSLIGSAKSSSLNETAKQYSNKQRVLSVGYVLEQLNSMSVESTDRLEEENYSREPKPMTMKGANNVCDNESEDKAMQSDDVKDNEADFHIDTEVYEDISDSVVNPEAIDKYASSSGDKITNSNSDDDKDNRRHGVKRSHESEPCESSIDKVKSAYQLMGLMYDTEHFSKIRKASVWYKKRFSQIRFQNRILRLQKPPNRHTYFDNDKDACEDLTLQKANSFGVQDSEKNISGELFIDAKDDTISNQPQHSKLEMEEFSEKDDSTDDDQDIYFSAEEENSLENEEKREKKLKVLPKRRRKRQSKKKSIAYPQEMIDNPIIKKFWRRRYSLFSKFDEGIKMDAESWYSVTPEKIAVNIAERCQCDLVIDAFCGAGGNAIQLAFTCERVIAIDIDPYKIELARNNAKVYGVEDRIEFIVGDYLQLAPTLTADVVFLSPPWGGPSYNKREVFPLSALLPVSGHQLFKLTSAITQNVVFYLPKNVNTHELVECAGPGGSVEVVQNFLDRELIALTAFFGELVNTVE